MIEAKQKSSVLTVTMKLILTLTWALLHPGFYSTANDQISIRVY